MWQSYRLLLRLYPIARAGSLEIAGSSADEVLMDGETSVLGTDDYRDGVVVVGSGHCGQLYSVQTLRSLPT